MNDDFDFLDDFILDVNLLENLKYNLEKEDIEDDE